MAQSSVGRLSQMIGLIPYVVLLIAVYSVFVQTVDDPYITFRYARNLISGHGAVFNVGERVEGFTSPLHLLLAALLLKIFPAADILFKAKLVSVFFAFLLLVQIRRLAQSLGLTWGEAVVAQLLVALNINFALAAVNGLETTLYACLLTAAVQAMLAEWAAGPEKRGYLSGLVLFFAFLTRPDVLVIFSLLLCAQLLRLWQRKLSGAQCLRWCLAFALPAALLTLGRLLYYGAPLPNTFYAKHVTLLTGLQNGFQYLARGVSPEAVGLRNGLSLYAPFNDHLLLFCLCLFWGLALLGLAEMRKKAHFPLFAALLVAMLVLILRTGGDWMFGWRFVIAFLPFLAILQCGGLRIVSALLSQSYGRFRSPAFPVAVLLLSWGGALLLGPHLSWKTVNFSTSGEKMLLKSRGLGPQWVVVGNFIHDRLPTDASVAYSELGYAGFTNMDKSFLDVRGLTDSQIARLPASLKDRWGVIDPNWYRPEDPLGAILRRHAPDAIIDWGPLQRPARIFDNSYRLTLPDDKTQAVAKKYDITFVMYQPASRLSLCAPASPDAASASRQ